MGNINVRNAHFGESVTASGVDLIADEGDTLLTVTMPDGSTGLVVLLPPGQTILLGKALFEAGRTGKRMKRLAEQKSQD